MTDTIAAIATPSGEGGIAIVRVSGDDSLKILKGAFRGNIAPRRAIFGLVIDHAGEVIDEAIAIYMPAPRSYTREDVAEIQCHGGYHVAKRVLERVFELGAREAGPGEFTKRAFLNGRLDLAQAEAVMSVVKASSDAALRSANRQLHGGLSRQIQAIADDLKGVLAGIEAACDFPEEIDEAVEAAAVVPRLETAAHALERAIDPRGARLIERGVMVALVGRPNTGKSSIMNALSGFDRAIVSPLPGTTRDAVTASVEIDRTLYNLTDTAGQRATADEIEKIGVSIAQRAQQNADIVVVVLDGTAPLTEEDRQIIALCDERYIIAVNKSDLYGENPVIDLSELPAARVVFVSAINYIEPLIDELRELAHLARPDSDILTLKRHVDLATSAIHSLNAALESARAGFPLDLCAVDVQSALASLLNIRGLDAAEETIDAIFSQFCVGK